MDDSLDSLISFSDFLFAFQVQFCFDGKCLSFKFYLKLAYS